MMPRNFLAEHPSHPLILDASASIGLNAIGRPSELFRRLPQRAVITDVVVTELERGRITGRHDIVLVRELIAAQVIELRSLGARGLKVFESLVIGPAAETLDDGEAATIALALELDGIAVLDERKANRICDEKFPRLLRRSSVDLLLSDEARDAIGNDDFREVVAGAIEKARVRVLPAQLRNLVEVIGADLADRCPSLGNWRRRLGSQISC